jgi:hypothetical protein
MESGIPFNGTGLQCADKSDYNQLSGDETGVKQSTGTLPVTP